MNKDIIIYLESTGDVIAILTNVVYGNYSSKLLGNGIAMTQVDNARKYITEDMKFKNQNDNIVYLDEYRIKRRS